MKLAIFNGSPRYKKSNSKVLIEHFLIGYKKIESEPVSIQYIANRKQKEEQLEIYKSAEIVIIIFPLYTDSMPGIVKEFFETIAQLKQAQNKKIGFIVQSGFTEVIHSVFVERYLEKLTIRLKTEYLGSIIKGGVEGIQAMPSWLTKKLFNRFQNLGEYFAKTNTFSPKIKSSLRKPYKMSLMSRFGFNVLNRIGFTNIYWNSMLKKNKAYKNRFDKPFIESTPET